MDEMQAGEVSKFADGSWQLLITGSLKGAVLGSMQGNGKEHKFYIT